ncbi:MAG: hypothetical protein ACOYN4_04425, partial [Bacteroidales bacterium]
AARSRFNAARSRFNAARSRFNAARSMVQGSMLCVHTSTGSVFGLPVRLFKCSIVHLFNCSNIQMLHIQGSML